MLNGLECSDLYCFTKQIKERLSYFDLCRNYLTLSYSQLRTARQEQLLIANAAFGWAAGKTQADFRNFQPLMVNLAYEIRTNFHCYRHCTTKS